MFNCTKYFNENVVSPYALVTALFFLSRLGDRMQKKDYTVTLSRLRKMYYLIVKEEVHHASGMRNKGWKSAGKSLHRVTCIVRAAGSGANGRWFPPKISCLSRDENKSTSPFRRHPRVRFGARDGGGSVKYKLIVSSMPTHCRWTSQRWDILERSASQLSSANAAAGRVLCHGVQLSIATLNVLIYSWTDWRNMKIFIFTTQIDIFCTVQTHLRLDFSEPLCVTFQIRDSSESHTNVSLYQ